jgi:hypothetical protein
MTGLVTITSPLRGEVARNARVGVTHWMSRKGPPPPSDATTLTLQGRVNDTFGGSN